MKINREVLIDGLVMLALAGYVFWNIPTVQERYQVFAGAVGAVVALAGTLTLFRFRWAPEIVVSVAVLTGCWGAHRLIFDGYSHGRLALVLMMVGAVIWTYPELRRAIREPTIR